jgi:hypothetical protein
MAKDQFTKQWITENSIDVVSQYADGVLTIRGLHYQLVALGMTNTMRHYRRVVNAMIDARRSGEVSYYAFSDRDRQMERLTDWEEESYDEKFGGAKDQIEVWASDYRLNRWENQPYYPEVWIEKKALIGAFERTCDQHNIALCACKGYPSLTFLRDGGRRFNEAEINGKKPIILYFGDYDPSGEDIPRSIKENLWKDFGVDVEVRRIALMEEQVVEWGLPPAPAKSGDSRTAMWDGLGQVELDAVRPEELRDLLRRAIGDIFDAEKHEELIEREEEEREKFQEEIQEFVKGMYGGEADED